MKEIIYPPGCKDIQVELANDELIRRLKKIQQSYQNLDAKAAEKYNALSIYLGCDLFLQHEHEDVQLLVACCLADTFRIHHPESPFHDATNLKNIFIFLANQLRGLKDNANPSFSRYFYLLENLENTKTFPLCIELDDAQDIIAAVFENVFKIVNDKTTSKVKSLLFELLHPLLNESDQVSARVLDILFTRIIEPQKSNNKEANSLAINLLKKGNEHFEFLVQNHLNNISLTTRGTMGQNLTLTSGYNPNTSLDASMGSNESPDASLNYPPAAETPGLHGSSSQFISDKLCLIIYELSKIRHAFLELVMPQLEYKLKSSDLKERREFTKLLSKMFSEKDSKLVEQLPQLWDAYLERFSDMNEDIRKICVQHICDFLIQQASSIKSITGANSSTSGTSKSNQIIEQILEQVKNRSLDSEESLRYEVVQEILKAIKLESDLITIDLLNILKERTLDVKIRVRKSALLGLASLYKKIHAKTSNTRSSVQIVNFIPSKIMRIFFQDSVEDKLLVERCLNSSIVPYTLEARDKMAQLYYAFSTFDEYSYLSFVEIMKNRVLLFHLMKSIIDLNESGSNEAKLNSEIAHLSQQLLDPVKGHDFVKALLNLFKTNLNLKNYFKTFVNSNCSCSKTLQLINLILTNINSLNQTQSTMAKRLIERMSSLIIDKECFECLIELVEYKVKQKLTLKQRKMLLKNRDKPISSSGDARKRGKKKNKEAQSESEASENDENESFEEDKYSDEEHENESNVGDEDEEGENSQNDKILVKHVDDDGDKGLKLIKTILMIHTSSGFANPITYEKLFLYINSRKEHIISNTLQILSSYYGPMVRATFSRDQLESFNKVNNLHLEKLKQFCLSGKPRQAKYAVHLIYSNFEKPNNEQILYDLFKDLQAEILAKNHSTYITSLISLGHICFLIPHKVGNEVKEFMSKSIVKEILISPFNLSAVDVNNSGSGGDVSVSMKRKNNLKLAGKWCENEEELPFNTRARIEAVKLVIRWCLGLKSECTNIISVLKILIKLIKDNSTPEQSLSTSSSDSETITEAEKSRLRSTCGSKLIKLAQENSFKPLITAEYFHTLARLIIDPVTNVRDVIVKKLNRGLRSTKLPIYYMSIFALSGLDTSKERKTRIKRLYSSLIKTIRMNDAKEQTRQKTTGQQTTVSKTRIVPEMCLSYAVSLLAHNIKIDSLVKDEGKVKQIKECMSIILDPLLEQPDAHQITYIKKVLNKIKESDDGLMAVHIQPQENKSPAVTEKISQNLYLMNKRLCFICEVFLFHMHSKSSNYLAPKEYQFDVKLPSGFFAVRDASAASTQHQEKINKEVQEGLKHGLKNTINGEDDEKDETENSENQHESYLDVSKKPVASSKKRKASIEQNELKKKNSKIDEDNDDEDEDDENISLNNLIKAKNKNINESKNSSINDASNNSSLSQEQKPPTAKRNRKNAQETNASDKKQIKLATNDEEEDVVTSKKTTREKKTHIEASPPAPALLVASKKTPGRKAATTASPKKSNKKDIEEEEEEKENDNVEEEIEDLKSRPASRKSSRSKSTQETTMITTKATASKKALSQEETPEVPSSNTSISTRPKRTASSTKK